MSEACIGNLTVNLIHLYMFEFSGGGGFGPPSWSWGPPPNKSEHFKFEFHNSTFELTDLLLNLFYICVQLFKQ